MGASASITVARRVSWPQASEPAHPGPEVDAIRSPRAVKPFLVERPETARASSEVSFGPFHLLPTQFLLLEDDKPVSIGSRALEILIVLLERPGDLISKRELMERVWPNVFVEPANLTVHISALRRRLRDGRNGNRFIINIPGRGYSFVAPVMGRAGDLPLDNRQRGEQRRATPCMNQPR